MVILATCTHRQLPLHYHDTSTIEENNKYVENTAGRTRFCFRRVCLAPSISRFGVKKAETLCCSLHGRSYCDMN